MNKSSRFLLSRWLELADDTYSISKKLMFEMFADKKTLNIPMYLLHWSIELYLKAFIMNHAGKYKKTHDLNDLFKCCIAIDKNLSSLCLRTEEVLYKQDYWIDFINPFGEDGGLRYLSKKRPKWSFPITIHDFFDDMVEYIKNNVDPNKNITPFI